MPTIVLVSPKGGAGKTTAAMILAAELARGTQVTVVDADPNHPIQRWIERAGPQAARNVISDADDDSSSEAGYT